MEDPAIIALEALGHVKVTNPRCQARYKDGPLTGPRPPDMPIWCGLPAGHGGPHLHENGHRFMVMDRENLIETKPLPDVCQKCGTRWPCKDAKMVINAFVTPEPCGCYPEEHCTDAGHGRECWCSPVREGNLIIHNQEV